MIKRVFLFLIITLFFQSEKIFAQWIVEQSPLRSNLNSISLSNKNSGWIVGDNGSILYKVKNYWIDYSHDMSLEEDLNCVFMTDKDNGWIVGSRGIILHFNGGNWNRVSSPTRKDLYAVSFSDPDHGIAVGSKGTILIYENSSWSLVEKEIRADLLTVSAGNNFSFLAGGLECVTVPIIKMLNDGKNTIENCLYNLISVNGVARSGEDEIWAVGTRGAILHFDGDEWIRNLPDNNMPTLNHISFTGDKNGICVGYSGTILLYSGQGWTKQNSGISSNLNGSAIFENGYYAVGDSGTIVSWNLIQDSLSPSGKKLPHLQIEAYPNPSDAVLSVIVPDEDSFSPRIITLSNVFGQVVYTQEIVQGNIERPYRVNTSFLNNGLYVIRAKASDGKVAVGKVIIQH